MNVLFLRPSLQITIYRFIFLPIQLYLSSSIHHPSIGHSSLSPFIHLHNLPIHRPSIHSHTYPPTYLFIPLSTLQFLTLSSCLAINSPTNQSSITFSFSGSENFIRVFNKPISIVEACRDRLEFKVYQSKIVEKRKSPLIN
jgi:hypothetical protein